MGMINGKRVRQLRNKRSLSQEGLAKKSRLSKRQIENIEQNEQHNGRPSTELLLAEALGVEVDELRRAPEVELFTQHDLDAQTRHERHAAMEEYGKLAIAHWDIIDLANLPHAGPGLARENIEIRQLFVPLNVEPEIIDGLTATSSEYRDGDEFTASGGIQERERRPIGKHLHSCSRLVIIGDPGAGKTTLIRWLATAYLLRFNGDPHFQDLPGAADLPDCGWLPFVVRCRYLGQADLNGSFDDVLLQMLRVIQLDEGQSHTLVAYLRELLDQNKLLLLIDGLDELDLVKRARLCELIRNLTAKWDKVPIVVTSRVVGFRELGSRIGPGFEHYRVADLSKDDKDRFIRSWCAVTESPERRKQVAEEMIAEIHGDQSDRDGQGGRDDRNDRIERLTSSPLMLTTLALVKRSVGKLPHRRSDLYSEAVAVLLNWRPEVKQPIDQREAIPQLEYLAYEMCSRAVSRLREDELIEILVRMREDYPVFDLSPDPRPFLRRLEEQTSIMKQCGQVRHHGTAMPIYEFRHQTFQEYLAARALVDEVYPGGADSLSVADHVRPFAGKTTKLGQWGDLEEVVEDNWREVLRLCVACCDHKSANDVLLAILEPLPGEQEKTRRARTVLAALCLADEPLVSIEVARQVLRRFAELVTEWDGQGMIRTGVDSAARELAASKWADEAQSILVDEFFRRPSGDRQNCGSVWAMIAERSRRKSNEARGTWLDRLTSDLQPQDERRAVHAAVIIMWEAYWKRLQGTPQIVELLGSMLSGSQPTQDAAAVCAHQNRR